MTRKLPLYACAVWAVLGAAAPSGAQEGPPCGACLSLAVRPADLPSRPLTPALAVVIRLEDAAGPPFDGRVVGAILLEAESVGSPEERGFRARQALATLRGMHPGARLGLVGAAPLLEQLLEHDVAPYVDLVAASDLEAALRERWQRAHPGLQIWGAAPLERFTDLLSASARAADGGLLIWPPPAITPELLDAVTHLAELLPQGLVSAARPLARCEPVGACGISAYQRADTLETIMVLRRLTARVARVVAPITTREAVAVLPSIAGPPPGRLQPLVAPLPDPGGAMQLAWPPDATALILRMASTEGHVAEDVHVMGARQLTAAEIVARHQAVVAQQARLVRELITQARSTVTFEVPAFPAPVTIQADTTVFRGSEPTELAQRNVRVNGVAFASGGVPRLPIIEPERVAAPPLAITLTRAYRYTLAGRSSLRGRDAYVLRFVPQPAAAGASLFQGRAWIDSASFALLKVDAVQTNLRGPLTSSQQIEDFREETVDGQSVWLLDRSELRQVYQGAGLTTPIHRVMVVDRHEINPAGMQERRREAHASPDIMLRETPEGLRYLRPTEDSRGRDAMREVAGQATRIRTLAGGLIVDPNITRPLPFAGVNYTDFDLFGTGTQLNAFFGGAYGQAAFSAPSFGGTRWQLRGAAFAMLARYNDRAFRDGRERYEENVRQRPAHASIGLSRPLSTRSAFHAAYLFDHTALSAADTTMPAFVVPRDLVVHGARLALETQRAGWRVEAWWNPGRRAGWSPWGRPDGSDYRPQDASFQRFGVSAARPWVVGPRLLARAEVALMGGRDLDRFSRYAFGTFDNRLRGYPAASIRYERGTAVRTAVVWQPAERLRLDGFADIAAVRDSGFGDAYRAYPGLGAALEAPGPFGLLVGAEWGFGFRGLNRDGSRGTHVIRITAYKVF